MKESNVKREQIEIRIVERARLSCNDKMKLSNSEDRLKLLSRFDTKRLKALFTSLCIGCERLDAEGSKINEFFGRRSSIVHGTWGEHRVKSIERYFQIAKELMAIVYAELIKSAREKDYQRKA